jgi:hypothetical protein
MENSSTVLAIPLHLTMRQSDNTSSHKGITVNFLAYYEAYFYDVFCLGIFMGLTTMVK